MKKFKKQLLGKEWIDLILYAFELGLEPKDIKGYLNSTINSQKIIKSDA